MLLIQNSGSMKRILLLLSFAFLMTGLVAQQDVYLRINHKLGTTPFQLNATRTNNLGNEFSVRRLQYYVSEITLLHDGGIETMVPNTWLLVDADQPLDILLGNFNVTSLESIRFSIGVDSATNHLDPSTYPMSHPLAPQSPSMHWGWSSGYRFIAMEGKSGSNLSQFYEIHTVEDENYVTTSVTTSGDVISNGLRIDLDADYEMALKNIDVSSGPTNHGAGGISKTIIENFRDFVFSKAELSTATPSIIAENAFSLYPNPSTGSVNLNIAPSFSKDAEVLVYDYTGRVISQKPVSANGYLQMNIDAPGCYLIALQQKGQVVLTKRMVVQ